MKELFEALMEKAEKTEAARQAAAEEERQRARIIACYQFEQRLREQARAEQDRQRRLETARKQGEEKKRKEDQEKHAAWLRGQEWTARMTVNTYQWKIGETIKGMESLDLTLFLSTLANPDLDPRIANALHKMVEAKKIEVAEYLKRELKEKLNGNPYASLADSI